MGAQTQSSPQLQLNQNEDEKFQFLAKIRERLDSQPTDSSSQNATNTKTLPGGIPAPPVPGGLPNPAVAINQMHAQMGKGGGKA